MRTLNVTNLTLLAVPRHPEFAPADINDHGQVVGQFSDGTGTHGFIYKEGSFAQIDYPGATSTVLTGINNRGAILGRATTASSAGFFIYDRGTFGPIVAAPKSSDTTLGTGLNDHGDIVGYFQAGGPTSFLYKAGAFRLFTLPSYETGANGINNGGHVVGTITKAGADLGFSYLESCGLFAPLTATPKPRGIQFDAVNNAGLILCTILTPTTGRAPGLYADGVFCDIILGPISTYDSINVTGLNDHGQIVGNAKNSAASVSFIATLPL
jgi:probable HAF family extracellular repeat protein